LTKFLDQTEPVIVLVGHIIPGEPTRHQLLVSPGSVVDYPDELHSLLVYLQTPRCLSEVLAWVQEAGGEASDVQKLLDAGRLRQVPPGPSEASLDAFKGLRLVPMGYRVQESEGGSVVYIGATEDATAVLAISWLLAAALDESPDHDDFPSTIRQFAAEAGVRGDQTIRLGLTDLDGLLAHGLARFEVQAKPSGLWSRIRSRMSV
jgi:hypothetical protein